MKVKNKRDFIIILIILATFMQGVILFRVRNNKIEESKPVISSVEVEPIYIKDIDKSLSNLKSYNVINRKREGEGWVINLKINGTKEEVIYDLKSLDHFIIKSYNITFNNDRGEIDLELRSK